MAQQVIPQQTLPWSEMGKEYMSEFLTYAAAAFGFFFKLESNEYPSSSSITAVFSAPQEEQVYFPKALMNLPDVFSTLRR